MVKTVTVLIENRQSSIAVDDGLMQIAEKIVDAAFTKEDFPYGYEVGITLVDNATIAALNKEYRGVDAATDVLSFAMLEGEEFIDLNEEEEAIVGDVVISMEKVAEQAEEYCHSREREFAYLLLHGVLHLLGYSHDGEEDTRRMRKREEEILEGLGLTR
ncbi:MAG: rRNA maturation RNase YbeY [Clostridia bacterium]